MGGIFEFEYRIQLMGCSGCGKTSICNAFFFDMKENNVFRKTSRLEKKDFVVDGTTCKIRSCDRLGQEDVIDSREITFGEAFMLVYSVDDVESFKRLFEYREHILMGKRVESNDLIPMMLVGNKIDVISSEREVSNEVGIRKSEEYGIGYFETSVVDKIGLDECFTEMIREMRRIRRIKNGGKVKKSKFVKVGKNRVRKEYDDDDVDTNEKDK